MLECTKTESAVRLLAQQKREETDEFVSVTSFGFHNALPLKNYKFVFTFFDLYQIFSITGNKW